MQLAVALRFFSPVRIALAVLLTLGLPAAAQFGWLQRNHGDFQTFGKITAFHLEVPLAAPPLASLAQFPAKNYTYALYPTASSGAEGMVPGNTVSGAPLMITVAQGIYDHHQDPINPLEFQIIKSEPAALPKAPGKRALFVYSVLYTGDNLANCTGILQVMELKKKQLVMTDQISWDCRGGGDAEWDAKKRQLTVRAARYTLGDKPCCPSRYDSVVFKMDGEKIKTGDINLNN
ncbi:MAG: hypothetical protein ACRD01_00745 [Terriglobales bacterium]